MDRPAQQIGRMFYQGQTQEMIDEFYARGQIGSNIQQWQWSEGAEQQLRYDQQVNSEQIYFNNEPQFEQNFSQQESLQSKSRPVFLLLDREFQIFGESIISDDEASQIYEKLLEQSQRVEVNKTSQKVSWSTEETHLLQWSIFTYALQKQKLVDMFQDEDWTNIAVFVPTRDFNKCYKRWLFIQKLSGNKQKWTADEDQALRWVIEKLGPKEWKKIAEQVNIMTNGANPRKGKQCRERWLIGLNPSIKKSKWTLLEDLLLLEKQLQLGNKWTEICIYIENRSESQAKNRFNSIIRKAQTATSADQKQKVEFMISKLKGQLKKNSSSDGVNLFAKQEAASSSLDSDSEFQESESDQLFGENEENKQDSYQPHRIFTLGNIQDDNWDLDNDNIMHAVP